MIVSFIYDVQNTNLANSIYSSPPSSKFTKHFYASNFKLSGQTFQLDPYFLVKTLNTTFFRMFTMRQKNLLTKQNRRYAEMGLKVYLKHLDLNLFYEQQALGKQFIYWRGEGIYF
jgi:hypothetical protein